MAVNLLLSKTKHCSEKLMWQIAGCLWVLLFVFSGTATFSQSGAGAIQGTVSDTSGGVVPNVAIHVLNQGTGVVNNTVTNGVGFYSVPGVFAGNYVLTFSAPGFKQSEQKIALQAGQTAVLSPSLAVGDASEKVEVTADTIQLATYNDGTVSAQLDQARISQIPMNSRNVASLVLTVTPGGTSASNKPRMDGSGWNGLTFVQDGSMNMDLNYGGALSVQPDEDSIQEVKIETSSSNAMYSSPSTVLMTTKSGTNNLHGSLFETAVNSAVGIARSRQNPSNYSQPHYVRNEFGGSVGGPIVVPWLYHGRNKSFFFFSYERYSLRSASYSLTTAPTAAMRSGDFSGLISSAGIAYTLYDPNTTDPVTYARQPFTNNKIDSSRESPLAKILFGITPLPTNSQNPYVNNNLAFGALNNANVPTVTFRLDHTFNSRNNAYLRFTDIQQSTMANYSGFVPSIAGAGLPAGISNTAGVHYPIYTAALGFTHIFSPTFVSQTVLGDTWQTNWTNAPQNGNGTNFESKWGLPNNFSATNMPAFTGMMLQQYGSQRLWGGGEILPSVKEDLTKTIGKHQIYFGGYYTHLTVNTLPDQQSDNVQFSQLGTGLYDPTTGTSYGRTSYTGLPDADLFLGAADLYSLRVQMPYEHWRANQFAAYIQDNIHLNAKLTINLGLRWDGLPAPTEINNITSGFDRKNDALVMGITTQEAISKGYTTQGIINNLQSLGVKFETPQQAGFPDHLINGDYTVFTPRLGFAYSPFGNGRGTVVRAGFGRYSYPYPLRDLYSRQTSNVPFAANYIQSYTNGAQSPDGKNNYLLRSKQTVVAGTNSASVVDSSSLSAMTPGSIAQATQNPNSPPTLMWEFNGTIEQPLKPSSVLQVNFVSNSSSNLDEQNAFNTAMSTYVWEATTGTTPPGGTYASTALNPYDNKTWGSLISLNPSGFANYNALKVNYQRLFKKGYGYQAYYVFAKNMRTVMNSNGGNQIYPVGDYLPGMVPGDGSEHALARLQNYMVDPTVEPHKILFNGVVDLPVGRGKKFAGNANRFLDEVIGGYQLAFIGRISRTYFQASNGNWGGDNPQGTGTMGKIHVYKHGQKVTDCSSGTCLNGYLYYNAFISPVNLSNPCTGASTISGVPSSYQAYQTPVNMDPGNYTCTNGVFKAGNTHYLDNTVPVKLTNGSAPYTTYSPGPGLNPFAKTFLMGPWTWNGMNISLFKVFPIKDALALRVNVDAFNALNMQGQNNPSSNGIQYFTSSANTPRQLQFSMRLSF